MVVDLKMLAMIFIINFAYITLNTIRFMLTMKGYRVIAPLVSMAEITIYVLGLSMVLNRLDNPLNLLVYALGYAVGISVGIKIEDYLALGYIMVSVILLLLLNNFIYQKHFVNTAMVLRKVSPTDAKENEWF